MGRTSAPRRRVAVLSTATRRWSRRGREVLLGKQDLLKSATTPPGKTVLPADSHLAPPRYNLRLGFRRRPAKIASETFAHGNSAQR